MRILFLELKILIPVAIMFVLSSLLSLEWNQLATVISKHCEVNFIATLYNLNGEALEIQTRGFQSSLCTVLKFSPHSVSCFLIKDITFRVDCIKQTCWAKNYKKKIPDLTCDLNWGWKQTKKKVWTSLNTRRECFLWI